MKRVLTYSLIFPALSMLLVQCVATQKDMEYTNVQVRKVDSRVEDIDKEVAELKKQTVREVRERQAETGDRLDYQQSELLRLQSEIEENGFLIRQLQEENSDLRKNLQLRVDSSEKNSQEELNKLKSRLATTEEQLLRAYERLATAETEITAIKEARSQEAANRAREAAERAREAERQARLAAEREAARIAAEREAARIEAERRAAEERQKNAAGPREILPEPYKVEVGDQNMPGATAEEITEEDIVAEPQPQPAVTPTPEPETPKTTRTGDETPYDRGMSLFNQKKYRDAYNVFAQYLDEKPGGPQAVEARFYAGQSLYEADDFELAILEYQKVIVEHPQHGLAPEALYNQGLAFEKIGDPETARIVYNKLIDSYPDSKQVAAAKSRLESLK